MMDMARDLGAEAMATGHYVRREMGATGAELHRATDDSKDQSYFLFTTTQDQLDFLRFPLGGMMSKTETRALAERFGLAVADKPDSQDICFVPNGDYASVVAKLRPGGIEAGDIVDEQGKVLGRHEGIIHFTVGQRRGINLTHRVGENNEPLYVLHLNADKHQVVVGPRESLAQQIVHLREMNWLGGVVPTDGLAVNVKLRSAQPPVAATFHAAAEGRGILTLNQPVQGVAPGQAGVIYDGNRVLGGGWINIP
jgi:tRNA-specific 2-thiouridylase